MSVAEILNSAKGLEANNFEKLYQNLFNLRIQRNGIDLLNKTEAKLLSNINREFDNKKSERLKYLDWKMEFGALSPEEEKESIKLAELYENFSVERLENLSQLAHLRQVPIDEIMEQLGLNYEING